jgi:hypothetical protein
MPTHAEGLEAWRTNGWVLLHSVFDGSEVRRVDAAIEEVWRTRPAYVTVDDLDRGIRTRMSRLSADRRRNRVKISDLYLASTQLRDLLLSSKLTGVLSALLGDEPVLCNSLNMEYGSEQDYHADSLFMTPLTPGGVIAVWLALEDVKAGSGALRVYSGSHEIPPYEFADGSYHGIEFELPQWATYMQHEIDVRGLRPKSLFARRGDAIIWHADLIHGAEPILDRTLTRRSMVGHYFRLADARHRGYVVKGQSHTRWINRRPQPVGVTDRILCAIERRIQKARGLLQSRRRHSRKVE